MPELRGTTIVAVLDQGGCAMAGDGQVTLGQSLAVKHTAKKVRLLANGKVAVGFAGSTADAFTLMERFEDKLAETGGQLARAAVALARDWRTDKLLRRLEAMMLATDGATLLTLTGAGDVIESDDGVAAIGSGSPYALAAARALVQETSLDAADIAAKALRIAAELCPYTNTHVTSHFLEKPTL